MNALNTLDKYFAANQLRANPDKMQASALHLKNQETKCQRNINWLGTKLTHSIHPVYLGVTLNPSLETRDN